MTKKERRCNTEVFLDRTFSAYVFFPFLPFLSCLHLCVFISFIANHSFPGYPPLGTEKPSMRSLLSMLLFPLLGGSPPLFHTIDHLHESCHLWSHFYPCRRGRPCWQCYHWPSVEKWLSLSPRGEEIKHPTSGFWALLSPIVFGF
jgi:hypothetical protein